MLVAGEDDNLAEAATGAGILCVKTVGMLRLSLSVVAPSWPEAAFDPSSVAVTSASIPLFGERVRAIGCDGASAHAAI